MGSEFRPMGDKMIVMKDEIVTKMKGGIVISDDEARKHRKPRGLVTHVGPGVECVKVNDYVMFHEYAGSGIDMNNQRDNVVIEEKDVLVILPTSEER